MKSYSVTIQIKATGQHWFEAENAYLYHENVSDSDSWYTRLRELHEQICNRGWIECHDTKIVPVIDILIEFLKIKKITITDKTT